LTEELLFIGSRLGDSLLIRFFQKDAEEKKKKRKIEITPDAPELKEADFIDPQDVDEDVQDLVSLMLQSKAAKKNQAMVRIILTSPSALFIEASY
jgi:hypothetical protein